MMNCAHYGVRARDGHRAEAEGEEDEPLAPSYGHRRAVVKLLPRHARPGRISVSNCPREAGRESDHVSGAAIGGDGLDDPAE